MPLPQSLERSSARRAAHWIGLALALAGQVARGQASKPLQNERVYLAPDDHTDYVWTADETGYRSAILQMTDYYLNLSDKTAREPRNFQSRWNMDGAIWFWLWQSNRNQEQVDRLVARLKDGHFSMPLTFAVSTYGGMPTEAVLRGMYYAGSVERRYHLDLPMAIAMEDQTLPNGLGALWAGAGARYSWRGICGCATKLIPVISQPRPSEIYWWQGPDRSRLLMKWYSLYNASDMRGAYQVGSYREAADPTNDKDIPLLNDPAFKSRYPYKIVGLFGEGGDNLSTMNDHFPKVARTLTRPGREVIVSNEEDFFRDFEAHYGKKLPMQEGSFGNEWDMYSASLQEVSSSVRRATEDLRSAETMETLVSLKQPEFTAQFKQQRDQAWAAYGLFWEHDWTSDNPQLARSIRADWQRRVAQDITSYVSELHMSSAKAFGALIDRHGTAPRYFVLNPLNWERTDAADLPYSGSSDIHVVDLVTGGEVPFQFVQAANGSGHELSTLRILATAVPSVGYKVYEVQSGKGTQFTSDLRAKDNVIENAFYRLKVDGRGAITSMVSKAIGGQELASTIDGRAINDLGKGSGTLTIRNAGPVSITLEATAQGPVAHTTEVTLYRNQDRISIRNDITEGFSNVNTWAFSFNLLSPDVWHEEVGAINHAKLKPEGDYFSTFSRLDWLTLNHFVAMSGYSRIGITLSNSDDAFMKLGHSAIVNGVSHLDNETPQISVLAGGQVDGPTLGILDQGGDTHFLQRFALRAQANFDAADSMRFSLEDQNPLVAGEVTGTSAGGATGITAYPEKSYSLLHNSNPDVLLWALKPAEEGIGHGADQGIIVRFWNVTPDPQAFTVSLSGGIAAASKMTHIETGMTAAKLLAHSLSIDATSWQMKTFLLHPDSTHAVLGQPDKGN